MADEWYFQEGEQRTGPISATALRQLAASGGIGPETLIWTSGLPNWIPAKSVKGLFGVSTNAAPTTPSAQRPPRPTLPSKAAGAGWHPFDSLVSAARNACPSGLPETISRSAGLVGVYAVYAAALVSVLVGFILAIRTNEFSALGVFTASAFAMIVIQYTAHRLLHASAAAIQTNASFLSSYAVPDCIFVLTFFGTLGGVGWLLWQSISVGSLNLALGAVAALGVGGFVAIVSLHPGEIRVLTKPDCQAGVDAVGFLTFLVKLFLRCAPIFFVAAIAYGTYELAAAAVSILRVDKEMAGFVGFRAGATVSVLIGATAIPFYAYLLTILYYLSLDIVSAIVSMPAKLDAIAQKVGEQSRTDS
jgi:hypothetical protein